MDNSRLIETNCDTACASETEQGGRKRRAKGGGAMGGKASGKPQARRHQPTSKPTTNNERPSQPPPAQRQREPMEKQSSRAPHKECKKNTKSFNGLKKTNICPVEKMSTFESAHSKRLRCEAGLW